MPESKKVVIKLDIHNDDCKRKALKAVSGLSGIESLAMDMKDQKLTVIGDVDPVDVVGKLKKWHADIVTVGPAKEDKKPDGDKKGDEKKGTEEEEKKKKEQQEREEALRRYIAAYGYGAYNHPYQNQRYCIHPVDDGPSGCVIC